MKHRIVIADDDPVSVSLISIVLGAAGYEVLNASSGSDALALIRKSRPNAVMLDIHMPGSSGISVLEEIRGDPRLSKLLVFMLTGDKKTEMVKSAISAGATDYITKPFDPDVLVKRVNRRVHSSTMVWD